MEAEVKIVEAEEVKIVKIITMILNEEEADWLYSRVSYSLGPESGFDSNMRKKFYKVLKDCLSD